MGHSGVGQARLTLADAGLPGSFLRALTPGAQTLLRVALVVILYRSVLFIGEQGV